MPFLSTNYCLRARGKRNLWGNQSFSLILRFKTKSVFAIAFTARPLGSGSCSCGCLSSSSRILLIKHGFNIFHHTVIILLLELLTSGVAVTVSGELASFLLRCRFVHRMDWSLRIVLWAFKTRSPWKGCFDWLESSHCPNAISESAFEVLTLRGCKVLMDYIWELATSKIVNVLNRPALSVC